MMLVPAAMFAMFYFLSIFVQNVMGYSPLETGFAFLPFSVGIVVSAGIASNLMSRVDPRGSPAPAPCSPASGCSGSPGSRTRPET